MEMRADLSVPQRTVSSGMRADGFHSHRSHCLFHPVGEDAVSFDIFFIASEFFFKLRNRSKGTLA